MKEKRKSKAGRNPKLDPAVYRYTVRFNEEEHNRFLSMFEKSGVYARSVFLKEHFFGQPFKVLQQYIIHIGKEVEVLGKDGKKWTGVLTDANEENFTITVQVKVKPEGAKRPKLVEQNVTFVYDEIKYTKYLISFK